VYRFMVKVSGFIISAIDYDILGFEFSTG